MNNYKRKTALVAAFIFLLLSAGASQIPAVFAQTIGDTLPTRSPTATPVSSRESSQPLVWVGQLASNTLGVTEGQGSIVRVIVQGMPNTTIELSNGSQLITAKSGTKPEYGPFAAEFAPVPASTWTVSVPALGVSLNIETDNYNLAVVEFVQVPPSSATQSVLPTVTSTPLGAVEWEGRIVSEVAGKNVPFARLLVQVAGRNGQPVQLATLTQVVNTAFTGQKPDELGPNMVEFTGLTPGRYFVDPLGLNVSLPVELKPNTEMRVEFYPKPATVTPFPTATETPTPIPVPPTATLAPTETATPTPSPVPTHTATPLPMPTAVTQWIGAIEARTNRGSGLSEITVNVSGAETVPITLKAGTRPGTSCIANTAQSECKFTGLLPDTYTITPQGLGISLPVAVSGSELVQVTFENQSFPAGVTGWQAQLVQNGNGGIATLQAKSVITANVVGKQGQIVSLRSTRPGYRQLCEIRQTSEGMGCQFTDLSPGIYTVEAINTGAKTSLFVDGVGQARIAFTPNATYATQELSRQPSVVGVGASPKRPTVAVIAPLPTFTPTTTPTPRPTRTPTPTLGWRGRVVDSDVSGVGTIAVRAAGLKDHPVVVRSGAWQSDPQLTGTKPEWGDYATEFGGLPPAEYVIELVDLAELKVNLEGGQFLLVEFRYDVISSP